MLLVADQEPSGDRLLTGVAGGRGGLHGTTIRDLRADLQALHDGAEVGRANLIGEICADATALVPMSDRVTPADAISFVPTEFGASWEPALGTCPRVLSWMSLPVRLSSLTSVPVTPLFLMSLEATVPLRMSLPRIELFLSGAELILAAA